MAKVSFKRRETNEEVAEMPVEDGSFIVTKEGSLFIDYEDERKQIKAVPSGGTTGQILAKKSDADNDTEWIDQSSGGSNIELEQDLSSNSAEKVPSVKAVNDAINNISLNEKIAEYEVTNNTTNLFEFTNLNIQPGEKYAFKIVGETTENADLQTTLNGLETGYYHASLFYNGTSGTSSSSDAPNLSGNVGYRPNRSNFYYGLVMRPQLTIVEGEISIYKKPDNNNYYPTMTWNIKQIWVGNQFLNFGGYGIIGTPVDTINKVKMKLSNGYFKSGTKIQIIKKNDEFTI